MACHAVMNKNLTTVAPDDKVEDVLALMKKNGVDYVAVVDKAGKLLGAFSYEVLFKNLLPVSLSMGDGLSLDITIKAAPGIAKRLNKLEPLAVSEIMERKVHAVHPDTPTWEGVGFLVQHGQPLFVVDPESGKLAGAITGRLALEEMQRLRDSE